MTDHPTPEQVRASIVPKSDQLNADDLVTGPMTVTITGVKKGDKEHPIIVEIDGHRPYKPCKTMRRVLIATFTDDPKNWVGQQMTLFCDPDVLWAGVKVGGIRISHLSGLDNPRTFMLTQTRGKKAEITVRPIVKGTPAPLPPAGKQEDFDMIMQYVSEATSETRCDQIVSMTKEFRWSDATAAKLADAIEQRRIELANIAAQAAAE